MASFAFVEVRLKEFMVTYMDYQHDLIQDRFKNIAQVKDGYNEQENQIVAKVVK